MASRLLYPAVEEHNRVFTAGHFLPTFISCFIARQQVQVQFLTKCKTGKTDLNRLKQALLVLNQGQQDAYRKNGVNKQLIRISFGMREQSKSSPRPSACELCDWGLALLSMTSGSPFQCPKRNSVQTW